MDSLTQRTPPSRLSRPARSRRLAEGFAGALAGAAVLAAVTLGAVLAVLFAATLAVVMVLASLLMALAALAWRVRPRPERARAPSRGHAWVTYGWTGPDR